MVYLPVTSSEALHMRAIDELRELDFQTFESFVIQRLIKNLNLSANVFKRNCFTIRYTTEEVSNKGYQYCMLANDGEDVEQGRGCFGFLRSPPNVKVIKFEYEPSDALVLNFNFMRHLRTIREFMLREENLLKEGIFLKAGSRDLQKKVREQMEIEKYVDLDAMGCSVYDCANVLKEFLRQMSEPLFLSNYYPAYERIAKLAQTFDYGQNIRSRSHSRNTLTPPDSELLLKEQHLIGCLQLITHLMPHRKREIFGNILEILVTVFQYRSYNRMTASALGAIFAPLVICPRGLPRDVAFSVSRDMAAIITAMIRTGKEVFGAPPKFRLQIWKYVLHSKRRLDELRPSVAPVPYFY